jgi:hypothetical protein
VSHAGRAGLVGETLISFGRLTAEPFIEVAVVEIDLCMEEAVAFG